MAKMPVIQGRIVRDGGDRLQYGRFAADLGSASKRLAATCVSQADDCFGSTTAVAAARPARLHYVG
jgi:hypothetical protein